MLKTSQFRLPLDLLQTCRRSGIRPTRHLLLVSVASQAMTWLEQKKPVRSAFSYVRRKSFVISTSRFGAGQAAHSNQTPLGLHRLAARIGAGQPLGTVFESRRPVGLTWRGRPDAAIVHRILWLEGLQPGFNRGTGVDTFERYIYIHGVGEELTLGHPASRGCIHLAAADLLPLFDKLPLGTLVWITGR